jgi:hypothetical protein
MDNNINTINTTTKYSGRPLPIDTRMTNSMPYTPMTAVKIKLVIKPIFAFKSPVSSNLHFLSLTSFSINFQKQGFKVQRVESETKPTDD